MEQAILKSSDIVEALEITHDPAKYAFVQELAVFDKARIDAWVFSYKTCSATAYEVKISRQDFLKELRDPIKRKWGLHVSNYFYFVAPRGLIELSELPTECGLKEFYWSLGIPHLRTVVPAPYREAHISNRFLFSLCKRLDMPRTIGYRDRKRSIFVARK